MQAPEFKKILRMFTDPDTELLFDDTKIMVQINGDIIEAQVSLEFGDIYIIENEKKESASSWIINRLARLPLLANRLRDSSAPTEYFISPSASYLPSLEDAPDEKPEKIDNVIDFASDIFTDSSPFETDVIYLTSDAGEGKTSLINELAHNQAKKFSEGKSSWLLVPIPLGGRHFMRFDDITIGALQNRYRFPFLYYHSFLALVKMGAIIPAFDGFEEMFVETSSGEALSAMGVLVESLESQGSIVIAARKAYFEFENIKTQEKLFDTVRSNDVSFVKLELSRWDKENFIEYCKLRGTSNPEELYQKVSSRLGADHALLTRAVLVKRLVDIIKTTDTVDEFIQELTGKNYFSVFVHKIIEREAVEKWIDRSGEKEIGTSLLSVDEHIQLLSSVAISMWESKVDYLKRDALDFVAEYFCELVDKNSFQTQQIRERIRGHAMLIPSINTSLAVEFDHDEFKYYFLGEGVGRLLSTINDKAKSELYSIFRRGILPVQSLATILQIIVDSDISTVEVINILLKISAMDIQASYTHENASSLIIRILSDSNVSNFSIENMSFSQNSLQDKKLHTLNFDSCYFLPSSLEFTTINSCKFKDCRFSQLRIHDTTKLSDVIMDNCSIESIEIVHERREYWEPSQVYSILSNLGVNIKDDYDYEEYTSENQVDSELLDIEKLIRYFMRSTHISESVIKIKLGKNSTTFFSETLPKLLDKSIFMEIENRGGANQRRFKLNMSLEYIYEAISKSHGSFNTFLKYF